MPALRFDVIGWPPVSPSPQRQVPSLRILAIHAGMHDSSAAAFDDYQMVAAVSEERLTRVKGSGEKVPWLSIDEVLRIAGWSRRDVDAHDRRRRAELRGVVRRRCRGAAPRLFRPVVAGRRIRRRSQIGVRHHRAVGLPAEKESLTSGDQQEPAVREPPGTHRE